MKKKVKNEKLLVVFITVLYMWPWIMPQHVVNAADISLVDATPSRVQEETILKIKGEPDEVRWITMTAYSSTPDQTDSTPFITANQTHVRWGIAASNFLTFNSQVQVPEYFGDQTFIVTDRMHPRFSDRIDIWFPTREEAQRFGKQRLQVNIWHY